MIAPLAITLALAFWTHATGTNPCPDGVNIQSLTAQEATDGYDGGASWLTTPDGQVIGSCTIRLGNSASDYPVPAQCALIAHELGHAVYGLRHEEGTIMDGMTGFRPTPGICYPPRKGINVSRYLMRQYRVARRGKR